MGLFDHTYQQRNVRSIDAKTRTENATVGMRGIHEMPLQADPIKERLAAYQAATAKTKRRRAA